MDTVSNNAPRLLTAKEVGARLGVSAKTARRMAYDGRLPAIKLGRSPKAPLRFDVDELDAWLYSKEGTS
jgi:excisionase family DNA binding protein